MKICRFNILFGAHQVEMLFYLFLNFQNWLFLFSDFIKVHN